ncbi:MAG TPA: calcium/sodium antiporter [Spongiibacteraceae bacterium]|nr:calcium/sodium antiporter [Spongiibacteraceae bacterium]HCS29207.1 calcium/sodium antiporter [Spongiibacteraceae bacterium]
MILQITGLIVGLVALVWSADRFVIGASATARILGVSPLVIGILVVGIGTSAPEMLVSAIAAFQGQTGLSVGNALGSNITNIGLILGVTALVAPLEVRSKILFREIPLLILVMLVGFLLLRDGQLNVMDGTILLCGFAAVVLRQLWEAKHGIDDPLAGEYEASLEKEMTLAAALLWLLVGFVVLLISARLMVWAAVDIAQALGVSDLVIGLTIVAVGTSLPELAASVAAVRKNEHDIALGNVLGSNLFNLLGVMALPGVIAPGAVDAAVLSRDYPVMIGLSLLLFIVAYSFRGSRRIERWEGGLLVALYMAYLGLLVYTA